MAVDRSGNVFVTDGFYNRVQKFTNTGDFVTAWGTHGTAPGQFSAPAYLDVINPGIAVFKEYVYVPEAGNNRIQIFTWKPEVQPTPNLKLKGSTK
ncbi:MAG TPA: hypothetical protein VE089_05045 [Nitrososphaeraceae archaeon]|nr:hypothetical protein [Nitrososphaeraceae archaeon]